MYYHKMKNNKKKNNRSNLHTTIKNFTPFMADTKYLEHLHKEMKLRSECYSWDTIYHTWIVWECRNMFVFQEFLNLFGENLLIICNFNSPRETAMFQASKPSKLNWCSTVMLDSPDIVL